MTTVTITDCRKQIHELADEVSHHGKRVCVNRNGKPAFVMVPIDDAEALIAIEDKIDIQEARKALKKGDFIGLNELKDELGI
jgi:prevent-host-death family protein